MNIKNNKLVLVDQKELYEIGSKFISNTVINRNKCIGCNELYEYDKNTKLSDQKIILKKNERFKCYGCNKYVRRSHGVYLFSCVKCGELNQKYRHFTSDLTGRVSFVSGIRTKLGHQICLKLLRAGSKVIGTTRYPEIAIEIYKKYSDYEIWSCNLSIWSEPFDMNNSNIKSDTDRLKEFIKNSYGKLDILINCAAQTIRNKEKNVNTDNKTELNRYGDHKYLDNKYENSWCLTLDNVVQNEMEEIFRVNSIAPVILFQSFKELLELSEYNPHIVNVHSREGIFNISKSKFHPHLNMGKAALAMFTKMLISSKYKTTCGKQFYIHGCDPGWISVDEYYQTNSPWIVPPLDEIDGASRIVYPIFANSLSCSKTIRHYNHIIL